MPLQPSGAPMLLACPGALKQVVEAVLIILDSYGALHQLVQGFPLGSQPHPLVLVQPSHLPSLGPLVGGALCQEWTGVEPLWIEGVGQVWQVVGVAS